VAPESVTVVDAGAGPNKDFPWRFPALHVAIHYLPLHTKDIDCHQWHLGKASKKDRTLSSAIIASLRSAS
jgi:hypothetical protein